jgi:transcriptional regulator with XRE-family HTH domain
MIGEQIKKARHLAGLSQKQLGDLVGKGISTVSEWESGKRSPDVDLLPVISEALHVSMGYLIGVTDNPRFGKTEKAEIVQPTRETSQLIVSYNLAPEWKKKAVRELLGMDDFYD